MLLNRYISWPSLTYRVFRAIDDTHSRIAACKVVNLFISPTLGHGTPNTKELQKEVQVHKALKSDYILEFIHSEIIDREKEREGWVPGLYILLELALGGDLFDKIGMSLLWSIARTDRG
jgi:serine/threonine-protein kinase Chk1